MILATMEDSGHISSIITQNIDGLHKKAGSKNIIEIHGNIWNVRCEYCGKVEYRNETDGMLKCSSCGEMTRPDVVLFGETVKRIDEAFEIIRKSDNIIVIGTSSLVYPAALLPYEGKKYGANIIEINIVRTELSEDADYFIEGKAAETVPKIYNIIKEL